MGIPTLEVALARILASLMMHIATLTELKEAIDKIKYSTNHCWKFRNRSVAFFSGFLQATSIVLVTLLGYYIILVKSTSVLDIAKDYLAMMVIADFDNFLYSEHSVTDPIKNVVEDQTGAYSGLLTVTSTTSKDCVGPDENPHVNRRQPDEAVDFVNSLEFHLANKSKNEDNGAFIRIKQPDSILI